MHLHFPIYAVIERLLVDAIVTVTLLIEKLVIYTTEKVISLNVMFTLLSRLKRD
jgi:hypothetical protein